MGCGASLAAHSPNVQPLVLRRDGDFAKSLAEPEPEPELAPAMEQVVSNVHLDTETLNFSSTSAAHADGRPEWELGFTFDAEREGTAAVYFGCGGPLAVAGDLHEAETDAFLRECEASGEISAAVRWEFAPGHGQRCPESLAVEVRLCACSVVLATARCRCSAPLRLCAAGAAARGADGPAGAGARPRRQGHVGRALAARARPVVAGGAAHRATATDDARRQRGQRDGDDGRGGGGRPRGGSDGDRGPGGPPEINSILHCH